MTVFDRSQFVRPIAHRGFHNVVAGRIENSQPAFEAAIAHGFGIECDLRPAAGGLPVVFHDETLERVTTATGAIANYSAEGLRHVRYPKCQTSVMTFQALLALVAGRVPILAEVKSEWDKPNQAFLIEIARLAVAYQGPLALMSFDPAVMVELRALAPGIPRGLVSGSYQNGNGEAWWPDKISAARGDALANLLESGPVAPAFIAYHIKDLPTPVTRYVRQVLGLPLFTWTVRSAADQENALNWADAPIFEGGE
jgi:glycerophosphoryl diester phosphodiesterase